LGWIRGKIPFNGTFNGFNETVFTGYSITTTSGRPIFLDESRDTTFDVVLVYIFVIKN